jgi:hypothetical protein
MRLRRTLKAEVRRFILRSLIFGDEDPPNQACRHGDEHPWNDGEHAMPKFEYKQTYTNSCGAVCLMYAAKLVGL